MSKPTQSFEAIVAIAGLIPLAWCVARWEWADPAVFVSYALLSLLAAGLTARQPGTPFTVPTDDTDDTYLELDLGLSLDFGADARLSLGYRGTLANDDVERHALTASLRLRF